MTAADTDNGSQEHSPRNPVLVIGAGIAGMQAALDLANQGLKVALVEQKPSIGGTMAMLDKTFPTLDCSACILTPRLSEVAKHPNIELFTLAEVCEVSGQAPNFRVTILKKARMVDEKNCSGCGECVPRCPIEVPNEFDQGLGLRKAIYIAFPQNTPLVYTIDPENCIRCELCIKSCERNAISLDMQDRRVDIEAGAIIVATGFELFDISVYRRFGYGRFRNVIHALEYERMISASGPTGGRLMRPSDGRIPKSIGFIQCVGARDTQRNAPNCSRICCMYSVKNAVMAKELQREYVENVVIYYLDLRAFGKGFEEFAEMARTRFGVNYVCGRPAEINEDRETGNLLIRVEETESGRLVEVEHELVVLSPGIRPPRSASTIIEKLGLAVGKDGFISVADMVITPVDTAVPGVFVCGCAQGAMDIPDSVSSGSAAAMRASIVLSRGGSA